MESTDLLPLLNVVGDGKAFVRHANREECCHGCGHADIRVASHINDISLCPNCYHETTVPCSVCHGRMLVSEAFRVDSEMNFSYSLCPQCAETQRARAGAESLPGVISIERHPRLLARRFSLELELNHDCEVGSDENRATERMVSDECDFHWHGDGSLGEYGMECVTGPIAGNEAYRRLRTACRILRENECTTDSRCGTHIHIDFSNNGSKAVAKLLRLCARMERFFFSLVPPSRRQNRYCASLPDNAKLVTGNTLEVVVYGHRMGRREHTNKYHERRYRWFNGHSYFYRGTVEIRLHNGTISFDKLMSWSELWIKLAEFTEGLSYAEIDHQAVRDPWDVLRDASISDVTIRSLQRRQTEFSRPSY